jgi:cation:H+ antiporter
MWYVYKQLKTDPAIKDSPTKLLPVYKVWIFIIIGLAGLVIGGRLVVNHAVELASHLGINEKIIGLTIVALGTSLPELATSVVAASKNNADIAVGNIIGSNIFNILLILSISAFIKPLEYEASFNNELMILAGGTAFLYLAMYTGKRKKLDKWEALLMLVFFLGYTTILVLKNT